MEIPDWVLQTKSKIETRQRNAIWILFVGVIVWLILEFYVILPNRLVIIEYLNKIYITGDVTGVFNLASFIFIMALIWKATKKKFIEPYETNSVEKLACYVALFAVDIKNILRNKTFSDNLGEYSREIKIQSDEIISTLNKHTDRNLKNELESLKIVIEKLNTVKKDDKFEPILNSSSTNLLSSAEWMFKEKYIGNYHLGFGDINESSLIKNVKKTEVWEGPVYTFQTSWIKSSSEVKLLLISIAIGVMIFLIPTNFLSNKTEVFVVSLVAIFVHFLNETKYGFKSENK